MSDPSVPDPEQRTPAAAPAPAKWLGPAAFGLTALSALAYFATSAGIRNFVVFLLDGLAKAATMLGWSA